MKSHDYALTPKWMEPAVTASELLDPYWHAVHSRVRREPYGELVIDWLVDDPIDWDRFDLVRRYAWGVPTPGDIAWLVDRLDGRGVVEIGAGTGYWAWQLSRRCVDVVAYDHAPVGENKYTLNTQYHPIHLGGPEKAAEYPTRTLLLCWPPYNDPMAVDALRAFTGDMLVHCGEDAGGCTADDAFFDLLHREWERLDTSPRHAVFQAVHDRLEIWLRRHTPRPEETS